MPIGDHSRLVYAATYPRWWYHWTRYVTPPRFVLNSRYPVLPRCSVAARTLPIVRYRYEITLR